MAVPFRGEIRFTFALDVSEESDRVFDALTDALESVGAFFEGGSSEHMDEADVIPGSPLARRLAEGAADVRL